MGELNEEGELRREEIDLESKYLKFQLALTKSIKKVKKKSKSRNMYSTSSKTRTDKTFSMKCLYCNTVGLANSLTILVLKNLRKITNTLLIFSGVMDQCRIFTTKFI